MVVVRLVKEDILAVHAIVGEVLQHAAGRDAMLQAQSLPELKANCVKGILAKRTRLVLVLKTYSDCRTARAAG